MRYLLIVVVLSACWRDTPETCVSCKTTPAEPPAAKVDPPMTRTAAHDVLGKLKPTDYAMLAELWFMYELQDVNGNEDNPSELVARLETELGHPVVLSPTATRDAIAESRRILSTVGANGGSGYDQASRVVAPVLAIILSPPDIEARIAKFPVDVGAAWFVEQYYAEHHYHDYNMKNRIWELVVAKYGRRALGIVEDRLRASEPEGADSYWVAATKAGRAILGHEFSAWYRKIRGTSFRDDLELVRGRER